MKAQRTAGEWTADDHGPYVTTLRPGETQRRVICITANTHNLVNFAAPVASLEDAANKTLLAAAPLLLSALEETLQGLSSWDTWRSRTFPEYRGSESEKICQRRVDRAKEAISKAKGGQ